MANFLFVLIQICTFTSLLLLSLFILTKINVKNILSSRFLDSISKDIFKIKKNNISLKKAQLITPLSLILLSILTYIIAFVIIYSFLKLFVSSLIISAPFAFIPSILLKLKIKREKNLIKKILPIYAINLKGYISNENNIILAIKRTKVEQPLYSYISKFIRNIESGMNVIEAFNILKTSVDIPEFTDLISAFQVCYQNGGRFSNILYLYSKQISSSLILEEKEKEKAISSIITLCVMLALNIFLVVSYIFGNNEFASIIRESLIGHLIMDFNSISCVVCVYLLFKMYKLEE